MWRVERSLVFLSSYDVVIVVAEGNEVCHKIKANPYLGVVRAAVVQWLNLQGVHYTGTPIIITRAVILPMALILLWLFKLLLNHHYPQVNLPGGSIKRNNLEDAPVALYL